MRKLEYLYEDEHLLIVNKPSGILSIPDRFDAEKPNLLHWLNREKGEIFVVHRIDRETSGAICFAKDPETHRGLSLQFESREVSKKYMALLDGVMPEPEGQIDASISESRTHAGKMVAGKHGKKALTLYEVKERFRGFTLVEADIQTGRTHQIRVHFAHIGYPLAIDPLYGNREAFFLSEVKGSKYNLGKWEEERPLMSRITLHAWKLGFKHPAMGEQVEFEAPLPKDFRAVLKQLGKWAPYTLSSMALLALSIFQIC